MTMTGEKKHIAWQETAPDGRNALLGVERYVGESGLDHMLVELVRLRASQINGCTYCLEMHTRILREGGEDQIRMDVLDGWRGSHRFTDQERAALAWTEAVTNLLPSGVPNDVYDKAVANFSDKELVDLTWAIAAINSWNRLNVAFH